MLLMAIAVEISGWPTLAAAFYLAALLLLVVVFVRADLFRINPKAACGILGLSIFLVAFLWVAIRPVPSPNTGPDLLATVHQVTLAKGQLKPNNTMLILWVTITNKGTVSAIAKNFTLIIDIPQRGKVSLAPILFTGPPLEYESGGAQMKLDIARENLTDRAVKDGIEPNGGIVAGILAFVLADIAVEDLPQSGVPMVLLYRDGLENGYYVTVPPQVLRKDGIELKHVPGIDSGEVIGPAVTPTTAPSPSPWKNQ